MALGINYVNEIGIPTTYVRIANVEQNFMNAEYFLCVYVYGYANENYRLEEKQLIQTNPDASKSNFFKRIRLPFDDSKGYSRGQLYGRLKEEVEMFAGAIDIEEDTV